MAMENFVQRSALEIRIKGLEQRIASLTSGSAYQKIINELKAANHTIQILHDELAAAEKSHRNTIKKWMEVNEDVHNEKEKALKEKDAQICRLEAQILQLKEELAVEKEAKKQALKEKYEAQVALQEEKEKMAGLLAKMNRNSKNSSLPSSTDPNHAKIVNTREKTGRKPGGQPGHEGHCREWQPATEPVIWISPRKEFLDPTQFKPTGRLIKKQLVSAEMVIHVQEFETPEYRNLKTGQRVHAEFPGGLVNEVTYDGSVKALAYMLNNGCNVSVGLTSQFIREASNGALTLSGGFINSLNQQFSRLTEEERLEAFKSLASADVFHIDFTFGRCSGKTTTVAITCDDKGHVLYQAKEAKGDKGVKGTPAEFNQGTCVSDHEPALVKLGSKHQDCLHHCQRYCQSSVENEPQLTWSKMMKAVIQETSHYRHSMELGEELDPSVVQRLREAFAEAIETGRREYEDTPPSQYFRDGYNLWKRMSENPEEYLLTLTDRNVPPDNDICERYARKYKRKCKQVMGFRSDRVHSEFCDGLSVMEALKNQDKNLLQSMTKIFNRTAVPVSVAD